MNYPVWDAGVFNGGATIALIAILHVYIAMFAVGTGIFLYAGERSARRRNDAGMLQYLRTHSKFFILVALVAGAISGVGIWFDIGLIAPEATGVLIRTFVWFWALEWIFFALEVVTALLYYYTWDRVRPKLHETIGLVYAVSAWMSLFLINGIISFMLTPGRWPETHSVWDGFWNPSAIPSLVMRTAVSVILAGLYALITSASVEDADLRSRLVRFSTSWMILGFAALPLGGAAWLAAIPPESRATLLSGANPASLFFLMSMAISFVMALFVWAGPYKKPSMVNTALAALLLVMGFAATGSSEWVREAVRKPFLIYGYLYSNNVYKQEAERLPENASILARAKWAGERSVAPDRELEAGEAIFRSACMQCHAVNGYNGIVPLVAHWSEEYIEHQLSHLDELEAAMPPFHATADEKRALAKWLYAISRPGGDAP
ncbi:MAG: cytochrome ubiquinol oxidase subunit I [Alicyclobacillaceae bacterium]|nr:cytochrome ubiquinol oxidase subunit I [Alicyclobacillaceae bacterium]